MTKELYFPLEEDTLVWPGHKLVLFEVFQNLADVHLVVINRYHIRHNEDIVNVEMCVGDFAQDPSITLWNCALTFFIPRPVFSISWPHLAVEIEVIRRCSYSMGVWWKPSTRSNLDQILFVSWAWSISKMNGNGCPSWIVASFEVENPGQAVISQASSQLETLAHSKPPRKV